MEKENAVAPVNDDPRPFRLIATLGVAGFLSGACLAATYVFTQPMIQAAKARAMEAAIYEVLPGCERFETLVLQGERLVQGKDAGGGDDRVFAGYDAGGRFIGYAVESSISGFQDIISGLFGYVPQNRTIVGLKILESRETPGLGDKIFKDADFTSNFRRLEVEPSVILVKKGEKQAPNEVDAITGATISSRAVVGLLNAGIEKWSPVLDAAPQK